MKLSCNIIILLNMYIFKLFFDGIDSELPYQLTERGESFTLLLSAKLPWVFKLPTISSE